MATAASSVMGLAEYILKDAGNDRWTETELLDWINDAQKAVVLVKPDANPVIEAVVLSSGSRQDLPATAVQLLDATYNMGTTGSTVGNAITIVDRGIMDACYPGWRNESTSTVVKHVIYDPVKLPKKYWVYPPSPGTNYIEIISAKIPTLLTASSENLTLGDEYVPAVLDWVLYRSFSKDAEYNESANRALVHLDAFQMGLGMRDESENRFAPRRGQGGLA